MKNLLTKNRGKIILFALLLLSLVITFLLGSFFSFLKFLNLVPIAILLGFGFTSLFGEVIPIKNIITFLVMSLFLGLFFNTIIIFLLGTQGLNIGIPFFTYYVPILFIVNVVMFFCKMKEEQVVTYVKNIRLEIIDIVWMTIFLILLLLFVNICLEAYFPSWDSFTFWALDSKYIFENGHLRDASFQLLTNNYLSFFPIQINYIYALYGAIVEQTAGLLSIMYAYIGVFLLFSYLIDIKNSPLKKSLIYLGAIAALHTFFFTHYVLLMSYADVFLSIVILVFTLVLFNKEYTFENYWKRFLLLVLLAFTLYLTKTHYLVFTLFLLAFYFVYDLKVLVKNFKVIFKNPLVIISILAFVVYILFIRHYAQSLSDESGFVSSVASKIALDSTIFVGLEEVIKQLLTKAPLFILTWFVYLLGAFFVKKGFGWEDIVKIVFLGMLIAFPTSLYVFKILDLSDSSLLRYLGLTFFATPLLFIGILPDLDIKLAWQKALAILVILCVPLFVVLQIYKETGFDFKFTPNSGSYQDFGAVDKSGINQYFFVQKGYYDISQEVLKIIPKDSTLMVMDYVKDQDQLANTFPPGLAIRYYLSNNNLGGPYSCLSKACYNYLLEMKPDYIVINAYDNYWVECNNILEKGKSYLVKLDLSGKFIQEGKCVASPENMVTL